MLSVSRWSRLFRGCESYQSQGSTLSGSGTVVSFPGALPPAIKFHAFSVKN